MTIDDGSSSLPTTQSSLKQHQHRHHTTPPPSKLTIYPLSTALFATLALVISIYNTIDCQFLSVDIGFIPVNRVVDTDVLTIGLWRYVDPSSPEGLCRAYPDIFRSAMIEGEPNWFLGQFAAVSGNVFGGISCFILWVMVFGGFSQSRKWKYTLCLLSLYCALAEGGRLFFFQIGLCQAEIWLKADTTSGSISIDTAKSCTAQRGTFIAMASIVLYLVHAVLICFYGVVIVEETKEGKEALPVAVIRHIDKIDSVLMIPKSPDNDEKNKSRTTGFSSYLLSKTTDDDDDYKNDSQRTASTCLSNDVNASRQQPVLSSGDATAAAVVSDNERCRGVLAAGLEVTSSTQEGRRQQQRPHSSRARQSRPPSSSKKKRRASTNSDFVLPSARLIEIRETDDEFVRLKGSKLFAKP